MVVLSKRLQALADMVTPGNRVADVGCDHGFVSIYLVQKGISPNVYAMDVREGPLQRAREHIVSYGLEDYIETRLSDGVAALKVGEADALICAGMGGRLMQKILTEGREKVSAMRELILQPQSEISVFRHFLRMEGYGIIEEKMVMEDGKYYPMMRAIPGYDARPAENEERQRLEDKFGRYLLESKNPVLIQYLYYCIGIQEKILKQLKENGRGGGRLAQDERIEGILKEIWDMQSALSQMEAGKK